MPLGEGRAVYLNLSPLAYFDHTIRFGTEGERWRAILRGQVGKAGIHPDITATAKDGEKPFVPVEVIRWDLGKGRQLVGVVMNPSRQGAIDRIGEIGDPKIRVKFGTLIPTHQERLEAFVKDRNKFGE